MCDKHKFVQLHLHTDSSNLDGCGKIKDYVTKAKELGHPALAITDHASPTGIFAHYKECKKNGIKPILGLEFYITNDLRSRISYKERSGVEDRDYHQSVYIQNKKGYQNYCQLTYRSFTEGYYYKPRIDFDSLFELNEGLIITSSCMASKTSQYIRDNKHRDAEDLFMKFVNKFGDRFYGELQFNEVEGQKEINDFIIHLCNKYDIPTIIGGDVHYVNKEDNKLQDALIKSKRGNEDSDWTISARNLYYHDTSDYFKFNKEWGYNYDEKLLERSFENSIKLSEKINFDFETGKYHVPKINTGEQTSKEYLEERTWSGLVNNIETSRKHGVEYTNEEIETLEKQVEYELEIINNLGLNDYMLVMNKIIVWCKENGIYVGPGRGSAAGSVCGWALQITGLDPLKHGLIFERFINPQRKVMADIDTDFEQGARDSILEYMIQEFGKESVLNVGTHMLYGAKSALNDMNKGLGKDSGHETVLSRKVSKLEGLDEATDLVKFFDVARRKTSDKEIQEWIEDNEETIGMAQKLMGQMRQLGTHAGGIVVTPGPIYDYIPVTKGGGNIVTAFKEADGSGKDLSELGILKFDILGLKTLNVLKECVNNIKEDLDIDLFEKIWYLPLEDKKMLDNFAKGNNFGIFQMDRSMMFTSKINVDSFEDIVAINAINRPGPLEKFLNKYGYWKEIDKGIKKVTEEELEEIDKERYPYPFMRKVLSPTYGCLLYQEQFMFLVQEAGGFDLGEADNFRRGIAWLPDNPKYYTVEGYYTKLEKGMKEKGYSKEDTDKFVQYCRDFAGYSFNKSHSTTYSYISWQTLYFKTYYPSYYYAAMLNVEGDVDAYLPIIADARINGIEILPHSITKSSLKTKAEGDKAIRLGLQMIKGLGENACLELVSFRLNRCKTIDEVLRKPFKKVNTTQLQNLIDLGCFDEFGIHRNKIEMLKEMYQDEKILNWFTRKKQAVRLETIPSSLKDFDADEVIKIASKIKKRFDNSQISVDDFFGDDNQEETEKPLEKIEPDIELINELIPLLKVRNDSIDTIKKRTSKRQKELIGFSLLNDNPIHEFERTLQLKGIKSLTNYDDPESDYYFTIIKREIKLTKTGKEYLVLKVNDGVKDYNLKCWKALDLKEDETYYGRVKKDNFGLTLDSNKVYSVK